MLGLLYEPVIISERGLAHLVESMMHHKFS